VYVRHVPLVPTLMWLVLLHACHALLTQAVDRVQPHSLHAHARAAILDQLVVLVFKS